MGIFEFLSAGFAEFAINFWSSFFGSIFTALFGV